MLFNPVSMPDYGRSKPKDKKKTLRSAGKASKVNYRQREKSTHRDPDIYLEHFVKKRKN